MRDDDDDRKSVKQREREETPATVKLAPNLSLISCRVHVCVCVWVSNVRDGGCSLES